MTAPKAGSGAGISGVRAYTAAVADHIREAGPLRVGLRALAIWAVDVVALAVMAALLPGLRVEYLAAAIAAALVIGLLNALIRPLILGLAANLPLILFALVVFLVNAVLLQLAGRLVTGLEIDSFWTALIASFGLAALNTALTAVLHINDDDSFYRNVTRRLQRRSTPSGNVQGTGTVIVQIDGLAEPILHRALTEGRMPTLARWLGMSGEDPPAASHRLIGWECDIPSMTSSSQAGILWGNNANIPAFRWYDKELQRLLVSNHPADARLLNGRQATDIGLLRVEGASVNNIFTGGAERCALTMATIVDDHGKLTVAPHDFASFFASPYNLTRLLLGAAGEIAREYWEAWRQRRRDVRPHMHRGGIFPFQRAGTNVLLQDLTVWLVISDIQRGRHVSYCDLLGYDEVAHHAGPATPDALRCLTAIDGQIRALERAAAAAPRRYQFVVLSDHGQSWGATFRQRYDISLEGLVQRLVGGQAVHQSGGSGEGAGYVSAVLSQITAAGGAAGRTVRTVRRVAGSAAPGEPVTLDQDRRDKAAARAADVVVCASGNLGLISFTRHPGQLEIEAIEAHYPGLLDGLIGHPGIGWLLLRSEQRGSIVLGKRGVRFLETDTVDGEDPLRDFPPATARYLTRLAGYSNVPDIVVNSTLYDAETGEVAAFEELIGCHGGAGGWQTRPFLIVPAAWTAAPRLEGAEAVHAFLTERIGPNVPASRVDRPVYGPCRSFSR